VLIYPGELDAAYDEGGIFQLTMHPHVIGYRSRIWVLEEIIRHAKAPRGVFATLPKSSTGRDTTPPEAVGGPTAHRRGVLRSADRAPNAGKSTAQPPLGHKLAILPLSRDDADPRLGIAIEGGSQIVYVDTAGYFCPRRRLDRRWWRRPGRVRRMSDQTVLLVMPPAGSTAIRGGSWDRLASATGVYPRLEQIDLVRRESLLGLADQLVREGGFDRSS